MFKRLGFRIYGCGTIVMHNQNIKHLFVNKFSPSQMLFVKYSLAFYEHIMGGSGFEYTNVSSLINTINLSSKNISLKLPTNCDTLTYNSVQCCVKALQEIKTCISYSTLLYHTLQTPSVYNIV